MDNVKTTKAASPKMVPIARRARSIPHQDHVPGYALTFDAATLHDYGLDMVAVDGGFALIPNGNTLPHEIYEGIKQNLNDAGLKDAADHEAIFEFIHNRAAWSCIKRAVNEG